MPVVRRSGLRTLALLLVATMLTLAASVLVPACGSDEPLASTPARVPEAGAGLTLTLTPTDCEAGFVLAPSSRQTLKVTVRDPSGAPSKGTEVLFVAPDAPEVATGAFDPPDPRGPTYGRARTGDDGVAAITFVAGAAGAFLVDALPVGAVGGATFAITVNADGTKPSASLKDARCRLERELLSSDERTRKEQLLHGPFFVPPGAKIQPAGSASEAVDIGAASLVFWVDERSRRKYEHATRFVLLDAADIASAPKIVEARYWPELVLPGGAPATLRSPAVTSRIAAETSASSRTASRRAPSVRTGPTAAPTAGGGPGEKVCAVVFYGEEGSYLAHDANNARNFFVNQLKIPVFAKTDGAGKLVQPTFADLPLLLAAAKQSGCTKIILYMSSHGGSSGPTKIRFDPTRTQLDTINWEDLAEVLRPNLDSSTKLSVILDACYSQNGAKMFQELGVDGEFLAAADEASESGAGVLWHDGGFGYSSYFTDALITSWSDGAADKNGDGQITLDEAFQRVQAEGDEDVLDPKPHYTPLLKDGRAFSPAIPAADIPCPGVEVSFEVPTPKPVTLSAVGDVTVADESIATASFIRVLFDTTKNGAATVRLKGEKPGQTTYSIAVYIAPYVYRSTAVLRVGECLDGGVDAGDGGDGGSSVSPSPDIAVAGFANNAIDAVGVKTKDAAFSRSYQVANEGTADLTISSVTITAQSNCTATVVASPGPVVAPLATSPLTVSVTPTGVGAFSCSVQMVSSDADESPYVIQIAGTVPDPCAHPDPMRNVGGKLIYRVPVNVGCSGDKVCAAAGKTCAGVPVLSPASAACVAFHPGTVVKSDVNGWGQGVYCNGTAGGLACNGEVQCHDCPLCGTTGLQCNDPNSSLLSELYVECK